MIYKCEICRQVYILKERPSNCPFCGSFNEHIKPIEDVPDLEEYELTEISKENLLKSISKEDYAMEFYYKTIIIHDKLSKIFNALGTHERWHYLTLLKEITNNTDMCFVKSDTNVKLNNSDEENKRSAMIAEAQAIVYYKKYLEEATEPRVKMVFAALLEVEQIHLDLIS